MTTKQLHIRLEPHVYEELRKASVRCNLAINSLGAILMKSAIAAVQQNSYRVPLPLFFEIKADAPPQDPPPTRAGAKK